MKWTKDKVTDLVVRCTLDKYVRDYYLSTEERRTEIDRDARVYVESMYLNDLSKTNNMIAYYIKQRERNGVR